MKRISEYLSSRKYKNIHQLIIEHSVRCIAASEGLKQVANLWVTHNKESANSSVALMETKEKSADAIEQDIIRLLLSSGIPTKLRDELITFIALLDSSLGAANRAAKNMMLLIHIPLPQKYATMIDKACDIIKSIFVEVNLAVQDLEDTEIISEKTLNVSDLESEMDDLYSTLKFGYFELEKSFESAAALIILDHSVRDLEESTDLAEDAMDILHNLTVH